MKLPFLVLGLEQSTEESEEEEEDDEPINGTASFPQSAGVGWGDEAAEEASAEVTAEGLLPSSSPDLCHPELHVLSKANICR